MWRVARSAKLLRRPILLDATTIDASAATNDALRLLLAEFAAARCRAGIVCSNVSRFIGLLGNTSVESPVRPFVCILLPLLLALYVVAYLDRANYGFGAAAGLSRKVSL